MSIIFTIMAVINMAFSIVGVIYGEKDIARYCTIMAMLDLIYAKEFKND